EQLQQCDLHQVLRAVPVTAQQEGRPAQARPAGADELDEFGISTGHTLPPSPADKDGWHVPGCCTGSRGVMRVTYADRPRLADVTGTFVTLGGGGFSAEGRVTPIDELILSTAGGGKPAVCFVPTATGDDVEYAARFERAFAGRARTSVLSLFCRDPWGYTDPSMLLDQDVIYVGGGSTANLLAVWRLHGLPDILAQAERNGAVFAGVSAGMNCWYHGSSTDSVGPLAPLPDGLGMLPGSACPHYCGEAERQESYRRMVRDGELPAGHAADDGVALIWRGGELVEAVSERPNGQAFAVARDGDDVVERPLPVRYLG